MFDNTVDIVSTSLGVASSLGGFALLPIVQLGVILSVGVGVIGLAVYWTKYSVRRGTKLLKGKV